VTRLGTEQSWLQSLATVPGNCKAFFFSKTSRCFWVHPGLFKGCQVLSEVMQWRREPYHSPTFSAEVRNGWSCTSTPPSCLYGVHREISPSALNQTQCLWQWLRFHRYPHRLYKCGQTDRQTDRQAGRQAGRQASGPLVRCSALWSSSVIYAE
jgi:hypothetical protein